MTLEEMNARNATPYDRLCDTYHQPMIGIMRQSEPKPPRRICEPCGGYRIVYHEDEPSLS